MLSSYELFKTIVDQVDDGVYVLDADRRIIYWNHGAERITGYSAAEVVGSRCRDNVLVHLDCDATPACAASCPAQASMRQNLPSESDLFLHHKAGHRLPVHTRISPVTDGDGKVVGAIELFTDNSSGEGARQRIRELERLSLLDQLTGLGNRRHGEIHREASLAELDRYGWPFGLLFFDIDRFKDFNDTYGHNVGDEVLKVVAETSRNALRAPDTISRWGGEEFTAIIGNVEAGELAGVAEKLRRLIEHSRIYLAEEALSVTVSIGATMALPSDSATAIVERADSLMYESKASGRNRVTADHVASPAPAAGTLKVKVEPDPSLL
jgi:diguanylate cyclase (GGDEF)-like protein/PAS domain S-box-containing protein